MPLSTYNMPSSSLGKVRRFYEMKKASGQKVQPWELESAYGAEFDAANRSSLAGRSLDETIAQNAENNRIRQEEIEANKSGQNKAAIGNLATTGLTLNYLMKDPSTVDAAGNVVAGKTPAGKLLDYGAGKIKGSGSSTNIAPTQTGQTIAPEVSTMTGEAAIPEAAAGSGYQIGSGSGQAAYNPAYYESGLTAEASGAGTTVGETTTGLQMGGSYGSQGSAGLAATSGAGESSMMSGATYGVGPVVAILAAAEMARGQWGGKGIPYEEKTMQQRTVDSPATFGMMASLAPWALKEESGPAKEMSRAERQVMKPIDWVFGDK